MTTAASAFGMLSAPVQSTCLCLPSTIVPQYPVGIRVCTPKVFNREELQYETYEMGVWDYWWGDESDEILEGEEILE